MGTHVDTRTRRAPVREHDELARRRRTTFKQYLRDIDEELLDEDLDVDGVADEDKDED